MAMNSGTDSSSCGDGPGAKRELTAEPDIWRVSRFRTALPQVLATCAQSSLLLELGMMVAIPTIVIAALLDAETGLSINSTQASWFAGIILAVQPLGSVLSGFLSETFGRKRCMMFVAVPQITGWMLMYCSQDLPMLYIAGFMMGFSIGFMEAPCLSYVGEICQPHLRANMCSLTSLNVPLGYLVMYLLGTVLDWRTTALCSVVMPILTVIAISQVPESPMWLLKNDRVVEAEAALCWLRGWVSPPDVRKEFASLQSYNEKSKLEQHTHAQTRSPKKGPIYIEVPKNGNGPRLEEGKPPMVALTFSEKLKDLLRPEMMRPLRLIVLYFFFYHCGGLTGLRPYMVRVFGQLNLALDPYWLTVASALLQISGALVCMFTIHRVGKRVISLISISVCSLSILLLGGYILLARHLHVYQPAVPLGLFAALFFFTNLGIGPVPWALISEVFPPRGRGMGGGVSSGLYYLQYFVVTKTFLDIEHFLGLHGLFFLYGCLGLLGIVFMYVCVPETEGQRLEDIEKFFRDKKTDRTGSRKSKAYS